MKKKFNGKRIMAAVLAFVIVAVMILSLVAAML